MSKFNLGEKVKNKASGFPKEAFIVGTPQDGRNSYCIAFKKLALGHRRFWNDRCFGYDYITVKETKDFDIDACWYAFEETLEKIKNVQFEFTF